MCCDGGTSAPPPDPMIAQNLANQSAQADRLIKLTEDQYADNKQRMVGIDAANDAATKQATTIAGKAEVRAEEAYNFYKDKGRPVVEKAFSDATNLDSQGNIDAARARASGDVAMGFANTEQQNQRSLSRMGINPSSGRFMAMQQRLSADKAAAMGGADTLAETNVRNTAINGRLQTSNLANGQSAQSLAQNTQALGAGAQGSAIANSGLGSSMGVNSALNAGVTGASGIYGSAANGGNALYSNQLQGHQLNTQASQASDAGWGQLAGLGMSAMGLADGGSVSSGNGGKVHGPGTGTSDSVKAVSNDTGGQIRLSNGEYVISADTVKALGTAFFDRLQQKHHTPVSNVGRAA